MCAVLCAQVCKVYRFQTEDQRWLLVREQMSETPLSFSLPKQLLSALIREHTSRSVLVFVFCWEATESVFKFYWTERLRFWQENKSFCQFYCREAQKHESRRFFHNVDAYGKNKKQPVIVFLRIQEVKELGDLSPHWNELRHDVINHCNHLIGCYQEMLAELDKLSGVWIKGPNHQTLAVGGESSNAELISSQLFW